MSILSFLLLVYSIFLSSRAIQVQFLLGRPNDLLTVITVSAITWCLGTWKISAEHQPDRATPGSYELNKSHEPRIRSCPTTGQHLPRVCLLIPTLSGRYCCAPPEALQGLHFSGCVYITCMFAPGWAQECSSNTLLSKESWYKPDAAPPASLEQPKPFTAYFPAKGLCLHETCLDGEVVVSSISFV